MEPTPRHRLATDAALAAGSEVILRDNPAHYLTHVLRLREGDAIALFNRSEGEWRASLRHIRKKEIVLSVEKQLRAPATPLGLTVCFAPIKGGRLETIIEKATELGASVLQPIITQRTIVDKVNVERADTIAREAAQQCERLDWPEIRTPLKLDKFLGQWPSDVPLIYGDETGAGQPITVALQGKPQQWGILVGPEGGFAPEELAALRHVKSALAVGLGPRILRADTAVITLCTATLMAWGDWTNPPRFTGEK